MSDEVQVHMEESPYGDTGKTYDGMLGMMNHWILQLESFRSQHPEGSPGRQHLENDILGYKEVLKSNSQLTARKFLETKQDARRQGERIFEDNLSIVNYMKDNGLWTSV